VSAGVADLVCEQGADWAVQLFWQIDQTNEAIQAQGPMDMDVVNPITGQRLIRLDDGANGGIQTGGAPYGIIELVIANSITNQFAPGTYNYDLFVYSVGPPLQRVKLLTGNFMVPAKITNLGTQLTQQIGSSVLPPDIWLSATVANPVVLTFDNTQSANLNKNVEVGVPMRARITTTGNASSISPTAAVNYHNSAGQNKPVVGSTAQAILGSSITSWINNQSVVTVTYNAQTGGLTITKVETTV